MNCFKCKKNCSSAYATCVVCQRAFHYRCTGMTDEALKKFSVAKQKEWQCSPACKNNVVASVQGSQSKKLPSLKRISKSTNVDNDSERPVNEMGKGAAEIVKESEAFLNMVHSGSVTLEGVNNTLSGLCNLVQDLVRSVNFQSAKFDDLSKQIEKQECKIKAQGSKLIEHENEIIALKLENEKFREELQKSNLSLHKLEQDKRSKNVEIHGVVEKEGEILRDVISQLADALQLPDDAVDKTYRQNIPKASRNKIRPIIVNFSQQSIRDEWVKKRRTGLVSKNVSQGGGDIPIYINQNLTPYSRELFWRARQAKKQLSFKFCWVNNVGEIFLKKNDQSNTLLIRSAADIPFAHG